MFTLAWLFLADQPAYRTGVIIVGLARCIAMVLIWNDIAKGDRDRAALLVVFNALFQVAAFSFLGYFYLTVLPGWLGLDTQGFEVGIWEVARTVLIFLGIPLAAGFLTRRIGLKRKGRDWYEQRVHPADRRRSRSTACCSRSCCCSRSRATRSPPQPLDVALIALPLLVYFAVMWVAGFVVGKLIRLPYAQTASLSFTVASNDFELAIAVCRRRLRRHLRPGARRRRRAADRGARPRRARLRRPLARPPLALASASRNRLMSSTRLPSRRIGALLDGSLQRASDACFGSRRGNEREAESGVAPAQVGVVRIWQVGGSVRSPMGRLADWVTLAVGPDGTCDRARDCEEELRSRCASLCRPHRRLPKEVRMMKKALIIVGALPTHATV